jgi:hypothetical protein
MKKILAVDCPITDDRGISQFMSQIRSSPGGLYDQVRNDFSIQPLSNPSLAQLEQALSDPSVGFLMASGHGGPDTSQAFINQQGPLLVPGSYDQIVFSGKIIHIFACNTAATLGKSLVTPDASGSAALAFIGYNADFNFPSYYQQSELGQQFVSCDSAIDLALAGGAAPLEAFRAGLEAFTELIAKLSDPNAANLLEQDRDALSLCVFNVSTETAMVITGRDSVMVSGP